MSKRLLVAGGAGFIGSHIVDLALAAGWEVEVLDDLSSGKLTNLPESVAVHRLDVRSAEAVGSSRVDLQACKLEYSIVSPK